MKKFSWTLSLLPVLLLAAIFSLKAVPERSALAEDKDPKAASSSCAGKNYKAWHEKRQADIAARDERLGDLVAKMDAAEGDEKIEAMAAVLDEMFAQRLVMHKRAPHAWHKGCAKSAKCEGKACGCSKCPAAACTAKKGDGGTAGDGAE